MEQEFSEQFYQLFESEKYLSQLNNETVDIDLNDLPEEVNESLTEGYIRNIYTKKILNCLKEIVEPLPIPIITFYGAPEKHVREISSDDMGKLRTVNGIIISVTQPKSFIRNGCFFCPECRELMYEAQFSVRLKIPSACICGNRKGLSLIEEKSEWDDYQEIRLQENPEEIKIGVIPRIMKISLIGHHLVDLVQPGDVVNMTSILRIDQFRKKADRIFSWYLQSINIEVLTKDAFDTKLTEEDIERIMYWKNKPRIREIIVESIYPSIYGYDEEKYGVTLSLFGGVEKKLPDITFRGQSHCLLIGDPSTAKTAIIMAASKVAPKGMYTQAGGVTGVGLTAAAVKYGDEWILEAGSVVLSSGGICCIDEIEKMDKEDRKKILECMGIQTVTIHKANIHTTLNAKTAILAAANPKYGRYDDRYTVAENINIPSPILARFDLIYIIRDIPEKEHDQKIADKIMETVTGKIDTELDLMTHDEIKKYILYAKKIKPVMSPSARKRLKEFYIQIRSEVYGESEHKPIPITPRQMQGLIRLTEAHARMGLKEIADEADAEVAIELVKDTLSRAAIDPSTGLIDTTGFEQGIPKSKSDKRKIVENTIPEYPSYISREELFYKCEGIVKSDELEAILRNLIDSDSNRFTGDDRGYSKVRLRS